jgi:hypothetical protein
VGTGFRKGSCSSNKEDAVLFQPAEVTSAYLKMGLMGFAGSGKTYTATETAVGLIGHMRERKIAAADKPMFFLDTETGSDWVKPKIEAAGIQLFTAKTRAFTDLLAATREARPVHRCFSSTASRIFGSSFARPIVAARARTEKSRIIACNSRTGPFSKANGASSPTGSSTRQCM